MRSAIVTLSTSNTIPSLLVLLLSSSSRCRVCLGKTVGLLYEDLRLGVPESPVHIILVFASSSSTSSSPSSPLPSASFVPSVFFEKRSQGWLVECCFASTETVGLLGTGAQDGHPDFHTAPELCMSGGVYVPCLGLCACVTSFECQLSPLCVDSARVLWASFCRFVFTVFLVRGAAPSLFHYFPKALKQMNSLRKKTIDQA